MPLKDKGLPNLAEARCWQLVWVEGTGRQLRPRSVPMVCRVGVKLYVTVGWGAQREAESTSPQGTGGEGAPQADQGTPKHRDTQEGSHMQYISQVGKPSPTRGYGKECLAQPCGGLGNTKSDPSGPEPGLERGQPRAWGECAKLGQFLVL